jgi:hypothetical protein
VQRAVGRRRNAYRPSFVGQRARQVPDDVADAADLAAGQGGILGREKNDGARINQWLPNA